MSDTLYRYLLFSMTVILFNYTIFFLLKIFFLVLVRDIYLHTVIIIN